MQEQKAAPMLRLDQAICQKQGGEQYDAGDDRRIAGKIVGQLTGSAIICFGMQVVMMLGQGEELQAEQYSQEKQYAMLQRRLCGE